MNSVKKLIKRIEKEGFTSELDLLRPTLVGAFSEMNSLGAACEWALLNCRVRPELAWAISNALLDYGEWETALKLIKLHCINKGWLQPGEVMWTALIEARDMGLYKQIYQALSANNFFTQAAKDKGLLNHNLPNGQPILIASMARSGTSYIINTLSEGLNRPFLSIFSSTHPQQQHVSTDLARELSGRRIICADHFSSDPEVLHDLVLAGFNKIYVHIRDPRQTTLSWLHYMDARFECSILEWPRYRGLLGLPNEYRKWSYDKKLSWLATNYYPKCVDWIDGWLSAEREVTDLEIRIGDYMPFNLNQLSYLNSISHYFDPADTLMADLLPDISDPILHYRSADPSEWRKFFPRESRLTMNSNLPPQMAERFGWPEK